jgi:hypothetical protein
MIAGSSQERLMRRCGRVIRTLWFACLRFQISKGHRVLSQRAKGHQQCGRRARLRTVVRPKGPEACAVLRRLAPLPAEEALTQRTLCAQGTRGTGVGALRELAARSSGLPPALSAAHRWCSWSTWRACVCEGPISREPLEAERLAASHPPSPTAHSALPCRDLLGSQPCGRWAAPKHAANPGKLSLHIPHGSAGQACEGFANSPSVLS